MSRTVAPSRPRPPSHRPERPNYALRRLVAGLILLVAVLVMWRSVAAVVGSGSKRSARPTGQPSASSHPSTSPTQPAQPSTGPSGGFPPTPGPINTAFPGLTTFRGNATRSYYGEGPVPKHPVILWKYPTTGGLCGQSNNLGVTKLWCGTGWTGQPNVIQHPGSRIEIREGAYDGHYHFLDGMTGKPMRPDLVTGDLAKGSATSDADGYPLYYAGSRDNFFRVVALDRDKPTVLYSYDANSNPHRVWNDDWDGAALQVGDYLMEGSENSWFYIWKLNRRYDSQNLVQVSPKIVMSVPGYDDQLFHDLGDQDVSIENSVAYDASRGVVYFANSGGLVQGWDVSDVLKGGTQYRRVLRFWDGDETDASIVIDGQGFLYVGRHASFNVQSRPQTRDHEVGSLMKLDPTKTDHPMVWDVQVGGFEPDGGILGTPALYNGTVYVTRTEGGFEAFSQRTGKQFYEHDLPGPSWMSPVPVDNTLLVAGCDGVLRAFDITDPSKDPTSLWELNLGACIESTPAVWHGMLYVGTRGGQIYGIGDPGANTPLASPTP